MGVRSHTQSPHHTPQPDQWQKSPRPRTSAARCTASSCHCAEYCAAARAVLAGQLGAARAAAASARASSSSPCNASSRTRKVDRSGRAVSGARPRSCHRFSSAYCTDLLASICAPKNRAASSGDSGKPVLDQAREAAVLQNVRDQAPACRCPIYSTPPRRQSRCARRSCPATARGVAGCAPATHSPATPRQARRSARNHVGHRSGGSWGFPR